MLMKSRFGEILSSSNPLRNQYPAGEANEIIELPNSLRNSAKNVVRFGVSDGGPPRSVDAGYSGMTCPY